MDTPVDICTVVYEVTDETSIVRTLDILTDEVEVVYEEENTNG